MTPLRLLIIAGLLYILFRLLTGSRRKKFSRPRNGTAAQGQVVQDVLVEDPVCHTLIPKGQAVHLHQDKKMYYFCSNKCCEMFIKNKGAEE